MAQFPTDVRPLHLAAIVESSDDAIISKDLNGVVTSWNRAAERTFGYSAAEMIGRSITVLIPADRLDEEDRVLSRIRRGDSVDHYETLRQRKDGTLVPISLTISPIRAPDGMIVGASKIARDISDRRRTEAALAAAEAQQKDLRQRLVALVAGSGRLFSSPQMADVMPAVIDLARTLIPADGYAVWRLDPTERTWQIGASSGISDEFADHIIRSYDGTSAPSSLLLDPLVAEDVYAVPMLSERRTWYEQEGVASMLALPLGAGGALAGTLVFYYRSRHAFDDVELHTARALANLAAAAIATAGLYGEQQRMREEAERANRTAAFLAEVSATLASSLDYEATLRMVATLAVPHIADWCAVDIVGEHDEIQRVTVAHVDPGKIELARTLHERYPEDPNSRYGVPYVIHTGRPQLASSVTPAMIRDAARDDEHHSLLTALSISSYMCVPLVAHGTTLGALTFVATETSRPFGDADLQLAQDVAYRAALAVANARAYRQANAANRAKDEFLAMLSHELRTPLNAVLGWTRMLRASAVSAARVPRALEIIERNAEAQSRLVEDLLDLSRVITGNFRLDVKPVHLLSAVDAAIETIQPAAAAKDIAVKVVVESRSDLVIGDAARLQQVIWNLLANAVKFTPTGGRITVSLRHTDSQIEVEVADTGEGIVASVLPYVFDRFRQGDSGTTRSHSGLGLGLAIVRHIAEMHGGRVEVASAGRGRGTTFRLKLPAMAVESGGAPTVQDKSVVDAGAGPQLAGVHALIVDDDPDARELLSELLQGRGAAVTAASSVAEGLAAIDRHPPDIIVSDLAMPYEDGFDLIRRLRARPPESGGKVPAIALTAYARAQDSERSLSSGFQAHLTKPVDTAKLFSTVERLARKR
jgi:PAS domain S-box-containing protein